MNLFERIICASFGHDEKGKIKVTDKNWKNYPSLTCARCGKKINPNFAKLNKPIKRGGHTINFIRFQGKEEEEKMTEISKAAIGLVILGVCLIITLSILVLLLI